MPHTVQWSLLFSLFILVIPCMFHSFYPSPAFQRPFQHCCLFSQVTCSESYLDVLWDVECDSGRCLLSCQPGAGSLLHDSPGCQAPGIFTSGFGGRELSVATCCAGSSRTPHVEDRVPKRLKIKPSEFTLLSKWGRPVLYKMANGGVPQSFPPLCSPFLLLKAWCTVLLKQFGQHFKMSLFLKALWVHLFIILGRAGSW